jgi:hypothetical protein
MNVSRKNRVLQVALVFALLPLLASRANAADKHHWKSVTEAQVKINGKIPLTWSIFQPDKKKDANLVLILLGHRWLMLDTKAKLVYQVPLNAVHAQGQDYETEDLAKSELLVPSSDWSDKDVGPAEDIHVTLGDYGRTLEIELPHLMDLRRGLY